MKELRYLATAGNALFILWMTYNAIDDGFKATHVQLASYIGLLCLLVLNTILLYRK